MKRALSAIAAFAAILCMVSIVGVGGADKQPAKVAAKATTSREADESQIRKSAQEFATAYNAKDAKAIAAQFMPEAEMVNEDGTVLHGKAEIEQAFAKQFAKESQGKVSVEIESIRFLASDLASEDGRLVTTDDKKQSRILCNYTVLHAREGTRWLVASARDTAPSTTAIAPHEHLKQLEWMIGDWIDEGEDSVIETSCRWDESGNFLLRDYSVKVAGRPALSGNQRIGWDPLAKQLKTWSFDSAGGESTGYWHNDGDRWVLKLSGVSAEGQVGSAIQVYTPVNKHKYTWQAAHRTLGGEPLPDIAPVTIVRVPHSDKNVSK